MNSNEIKELALELAGNDLCNAVNFLLDGQAMANAGINDDDQEAVEMAHRELVLELSAGI